MHFEHNLEHVCLGFWVVNDHNYNKQQRDHVSSFYYNIYSFKYIYQQNNLYNKKYWSLPWKELSIISQELKKHAYLKWKQTYRHVQFNVKYGVINSETLEYSKWIVEFPLFGIVTILYICTSALYFG